MSGWIVIACLCLGFCLGRLGSVGYYSGKISFTGGSNDFHLVTYFSCEELAQRGSVLLRVVQDENEM